MIFLKPRFVHFQCVKRFRFAAVDIKCQRLHFLNINNEAVFIDEGNGKRDEGVFHPHADSVAAVHDEEHSGIFRQMFAEHQTFFPVGVVGGNFDRNRDAFAMSLSVSAAQAYCTLERSTKAAEKRAILIFGVMIKAEK